MAISRIESNSIAPSQTLTTPIIATTMGVGGATPAGSGSGITFPASQSASTDANTLDDYEEGTWTVTDQSGAGLTFTVYTARYVKIGKMVTCGINFGYPSTANGSQAKISLPFPAVSISGGADNGYGGFCVYTNSATIPTAIPTSAGWAFICKVPSSAVQTNAQLSSALMELCITYETST